MLSGQAGSIGGKARQEVEVEKREQGVFWEAGSSLPTPVQTTKKQDVICLSEKGTEPCG